MKFKEWADTKQRLYDGISIERYLTDTSAFGADVFQPGASQSIKTHDLFALSFFVDELHLHYDSQCSSTIHKTVFRLGDHASWPYLACGRLYVSQHKNIKPRLVV